MKIFKRIALYLFPPPPGQFCIVHADVLIEVRERGYVIVEQCALCHRTRTTEHLLPRAVREQIQRDREARRR